MPLESQNKYRFSKLMALLLSAFVAVPAFAAPPSSTEVPAMEKTSQDKKPVENKKKGVKKNQSGKSAVAEKKDEDTVKFNPDLPALSLTSDLMYQILHAEFQNQYGQSGQAYSELMKLAEQTKDPRFAKRAAELSVKDRDVERSLEAVRLWSRLAPKSEETEKYLRNFQLLDNRVDEIVEGYRMKLASASKEERPLMLFQAQQNLVNLENKQEAFDAMERIIAPYQDLPEAHIALSVSAIQNADGERAVAEADKALALKPDSEMAVLTKAQAVGNVQKALDVMARFLEKHPDAQEVRIAYARLLVGDKQYEPAQKAFEEVLKRSPKDKMALYSLGLLTMQQGKTEQAEKYLTEWMKLGNADGQKQSKSDEETVQVLFLLSQVAEDRHHYDQSIGWLDKIPSDVEDEVTMVRDVRRAQLYAKKKDIARTRRILTDLRKKFPAEAERLLLTESQILREIKQNQEAYALLKVEKSKFPQSTNVMYDFALTAELVGQYDEMEKVLKQILEMDPKYQHAWNALGYSLAERNIRLDEAKEYIDKAMQLSPDDAYITDSLGWVFYRQGKLDDAEKMLRKAYALKGDDEIAIHLGEVLWQEGKKEEAMLLFRQVHQKDAANDSLKKALKNLNIKL